MSWRFIEKTGFRSSITNTKRRRNAEGKTSLDGWDLNVKTATLKVGNQQNRKIHQNPTMFFQKESFSEVLQLCSEFHSTSWGRKIWRIRACTAEAQSCRVRLKCKKQKETIRPPYWRNNTDKGKNTGVVLLRALTSTWPASPFLHAVYQTIIILSQIRLDHLGISTIFR